MFGLTPLGTFHTAISLIAVVAGLIALIRDKEISPGIRIGKIYVITTVVSCVTGLGIFQHGGVGKPHVLSIITLAVLGVAAVAGHSTLFHFIPGITETSPRLPPGAPLVPNADAPALQVATGVLFVAFLIGATLQVRRLRAASRSPSER
jgi:hypothetical protein